MAFLRRHLWKFILLILVVGGAAFGIIKLREPTIPEFITATVERGDVTQVVEAIGVVTSEKDLELKFPVAGLVSEVYVKEGDRVIAGQELARLRGTSYKATVDSARANYESALADLRTLEDGTRPEEIDVEEAELENRKASLQTAQSTLVKAEQLLVQSQQKLDVLKREIAINLSGYVTTSRSQISSAINSATTALNVMEDILNDDKVEDVLVKHEPGRLELMQKNRNTYEQEIQEIQLKVLVMDTPEEALALLTQTRNLVSRGADGINNFYNILVVIPETPVFTSSIREEKKAIIATERSSLQSTLTSLDAAYKALQDGRAGYEVAIATEQKIIVQAEGDRDSALSDIHTNETLIRIQEAQLQLKKAGARQTDIDAAAARVRRAKAELDKAQADFDDTILLAPFEGTITKVNLKKGEFTPGQFSETQPAFTMLGASPYRIEMYVAEIDIPKVQLSMSGSVELDAFPGTFYKLRVGEIDPAATNVDGVSKYLVKLDFVHLHEEFKIGMTGDAEIYTGTKENVIKVPARAIVEDEDGDEAVRIVTDEALGTYKTVKVTTGMEGESDIEVMSGVVEGETVILLIKE